MQAICVIGFPSRLGGADTELDHQIHVWQALGLQVHLLHTGALDDNLLAMRMEDRGCVVHTPGDWAACRGMHVISYCNGEFLKHLEAIKVYAKSTTFVNCMTWLRVGPTWIDAGPGGVPVGGISSTIVEYNPPSIGFGGGTRSGIKEVPPVKDYEPSVCECILRKSAAFTGRHSYFVSGPNSNSYLNCISKSCGLTVPREARGLGFDDRWCIRRREPRLYGMHADQPCPCVEWLNCNDL